MIVIICAMSEERNAFLKVIKKPKKYRFEKLHYHGKLFDNVYYKGKIGSKTVVLVHSGVGKVYAAILTTLCIKKFKPELVINVGAAGSLSPKAKVGDVVVATRVADWDVDVPEREWRRSINSDKMSFGCDKKFIKKLDSSKQDYKCIKGHIVSGDEFVYRRDQINTIKKYFKTALCCEMEGASVANTCYAFSIPVAIIRSITDVTYKKNDYKKFDFNLGVACDNAANLCADIIERY